MRGIAVTGLVLVTLAVRAPAQADTARATTPAAAGATAADCGQGSWVAGTVDVCSGELVYRDYVYDDFGARPGPPPPLSEITNRLLFQSIPTNDAYGGLPMGGGLKDADQADLVALR